MDGFTCRRRVTASSRGTRVTGEELIFAVEEEIPGQYAAGEIVQVPNWLTER